jgi:hypothetical protein
MRIYPELLGVSPAEGGGSEGRRRARRPEFDSMEPRKRSERENAPLAPQRFYSPSILGITSPRVAGCGLWAPR